MKMARASSVGEGLPSRTSIAYRTTFHPPPSLWDRAIPGVRRAVVTSTLNQSLAPVPTNFASITTTRTGVGPPLLTGSSCTDPYPVYIRDSVGNPIPYVQIGCGYARQQCCPYGFREGVRLADCPEDYTTQRLGSYSACCPVLGNFTLYNSAIGQTPCASLLTDTVYAFETPLTEVNARANTKHLFAYGLELAHEPQRSNPSITIALPVVLGTVFLLLLVVLAVIYGKRRRRQRRRQTQLAATHSRIDDRPAKEQPGSPMVDQHHSDSYLRPPGLRPHDHSRRSLVMLKALPEPPQEPPEYDHADRRGLYELPPLGSDDHADRGGVSELPPLGSHVHPAERAASPPESGTSFSGRIAISPSLTTMSGTHAPPAHMPSSKEGFI